MDNFIFRKTNNNNSRITNKNNDNNNDNNNINSGNNGANVATVFTAGINKTTSRLFNTASTTGLGTNADKEGQACYAFRRGNITFTSHPPARRDLNEEVVQQPLSVKDGKIETNRLQTAEDFCEICCGMRSPNSARRAQAFTTHFCTKIPAKFSTDAKRRSCDTFPTSSDCCTSASSSSSVSSDSEVGTTATISASASRCSALSKPFSTVYGRNTEVSDDSVLRYHLGKERIKKSSSRNNLFDSGNDLDHAFSIHDSLYPLSSVANSGSKKRQQSLRSSLSYLSLDDSYTSAFTISSRSSCLCCDASTATDISSNYDDDSFDKLTSVSRRRPYHRHIVPQQQFSKNTSVSISSYCSSSDGAKRSFSVRSSVPKSDDDDEDDNETCSSEMGWSFNSLCEDNPFAVDRRRKNIDQEHSTTRNDNDNNDNEKSKTSTSGESRYTVSPFTLNENRKRNVADNFGVVVTNLKKPGHHVGPIRNPDCFCDNCVYFYKNSSPYI